MGMQSDYVFYAEFVPFLHFQSEVLHSAPLSLLPKNLLKAPAHAPADNSAPHIYATLPSPTLLQTLAHPDQKFLDSEAFTDKFESHFSGQMEKVTRRIMRRWNGMSILDDPPVHG
jgi:hypothetical protein